MPKCARCPNDTAHLTKYGLCQSCYWVVKRKLALSDKIAWGNATITDKQLYTELV